MLLSAATTVAMRGSGCLRTFPPNQARAFEYRSPEQPNKILQSGCWCGAELPLMPPLRGVTLKRLHILVILGLNSRSD